MIMANELHLHHLTFSVLSLHLLRQCLDFSTKLLHHGYKLFLNCLG